MSRGRAFPSPSRYPTYAVLISAFFLILPSISLALWGDADGAASEPRKIKPRVTRPSGPTNVQLFVVSRSEIGVMWEPPLFDGGKAISKYLIEWDTDKSMSRVIASPWNPYSNSVDGPLVRSEVVSSEEREYRIAGLDEGQKYYVRVSAYGDGYSPAISSEPQYVIPAGVLPGFLTRVSLTVAFESGTADRLRLAWSAPEFDANGFGVLPGGCAGGMSPPSVPDSLTAYRVMWDTHPSLSNASVYDIPAVSGDGSPQLCCPSDADADDDGACNIELGAEVQSVAIRYPQSSVPSGSDLFDTGAIRIAYVGSQSKSIQVDVPLLGSDEVRITSTETLPINSPISTGDLIRIQNNVYVVSSVDNWPAFINISSGYLSSKSDQPTSTQAYFTTPPQSCFDVSLGNSAESFRTHLSQNFDDSPFNESISVSRSTLTEPYDNHDSGETRVIGYAYQVTFSGQGFSSTVGSPVEELLIMSTPACGVPFVSDGVDVSSKVSVDLSTQVDSGSIIPGKKYYVKVAGVNSQGVGPYAPAVPVAETPRSLPGLAQNCRVYAVPTASSSLRVEWDGVYPNHGQSPSSYRVDFFDVDGGISDPVSSHVVTSINEHSRYSITKKGLVPGKKYKVNIIPVNELGEGAPKWFSDYNSIGLIHDDNYFTPVDYIQRSCNAVPTCDNGSVQCDEVDSENFAIVARSVPPPPKFEVGTFPNVSSRNRFSKDSVLVTFDSASYFNTAKSIGIATDIFLVEWSTSSSFEPFASNGLATLWSAEVMAQYADEEGSNAIGELQLEPLTMGTQYFVRVSAHNTAGYGAKADAIPVKPMTRPDPPFDPILSRVTTDHLASLNTNIGLSDSATIGTSLLVMWQPPRIDSSNDRPDLVGDGGVAVSSYLVEWSRVSWDSYSPSVYEIILQTSSGAQGSDALGLLSGSFQVLIDTTATLGTAFMGSYVSAAISADESAANLKTILENIPNIGEVEVTSPEPYTWRITFLTELGDVGVTVEENQLFEGGVVAGIVGITKVSAAISPADSAYGFEVLSEIDDHIVDGTIHYFIRHLVPGMKIFVRVSSGNQVGFGPRRNTAPAYSSPALQRPDIPTSLYCEDVPPYLSVYSPTALEVHIGPPFYDGGSPLTTFLIEWDPSPSFDSSLLGDGSSLGSARADAASRVCTSCVNDFDVMTNTLTYAGSEVTAKVLSPQRRIMVHFHDDNESYLFSVLSATASTITVSKQHIRMASLNNMRGSDGGTGSNLDILGTTFVINGLTSGRSYHVRVSSENGEMGTGKSVKTIPSKEIPRGFPLPPSAASVRVVDKNTLNVSWSSDSHTKDPNIQAFKVESFRKDIAARSSSLSFYGEQEVVKFSTSGLGIVGGTFKLFFGELDDSTKIFLSIANARNGIDFVETTYDLSPHLNRGEAFLIGDDHYFVHETKPFTSKILPLADIFSGVDDREVSVFARPKTVPIAFNAIAEEVRNALERLPHVNHVEVRREVDDNYDNGYDWFVTFISNVGPQPAFSVDTSGLVGMNPLGFTITRTVPGVPPSDYNVTIIHDPTATSFDVKNLSPGKPYNIRVSSITDRGDSLSIDSVPATITPGGIPGKMPQPSIRAIDETTLLVSFEASAENNGAPVEEYFIETSSNTSFSVNSRIVVQPNHKFQRITTRAHTIPWDDNSSFTLSLGDFHGDFTVAVGGGSTTVRVQNGDNVLERSSGTTSLSAVVPRGDLVSVGGMEFRVCLPASYPHDDSRISLCSQNNAFQVANFYSNSAVNIVDELPIFILDTSLGAAQSPTVGDIFLRTVDALGSSKDMRPRLRRGDLIRVGHPRLGETFRVSTDPERAFTDRVVPLSYVEDANTAASLSSKSLDHATYEVQSFFIRSSSYATTLTPSDILSSGYRIRFKSETSKRTATAGAGGCLKWDGGAGDIRVELESMEGVDSVDVTREDLPPVLGGAGAGVKYYVTFTGSNVRGNVPPLQIVDVGSNGCLDAQLLGGKFGDDIAPIEVELVEIPYVPFYDIQTTADIPYDASSADMKAALESLSQACTVNVSRQVNRHGFSWYVTFVENEGTSYSPLLALSANGANLSADIDPGVSVVDIHHVKVSTPYGGTPVFARVAAVNSFGIGPYTLSNPRAAEASAQPPSEPVGVVAEAISDSEILVQWNPPLANGGRSITHYKIEYDHLPSFTGGQNSGPSGSISLSSSVVGSVSDVQSVTVKIDKNGLLDNEVLFLSGTFSLSFDGQKTGQLPYNASPAEVKAALEALCYVSEVTVKRSIHCSPESSVGCMSPEGYTWLVTFVSLNHQGDQHYRHISKLASRFSHKLSVDGSYLFECSDVSRTTCTIGGRAVANIGTVQEAQEIEIASSSFTVTIGGETSEVINLGDSLSDVEHKLNSYSRNGIGKISVSCPGCTKDLVSSGDSLLLYFASYRGDLPLVIVSDPSAIVRELVKGCEQFVVGRAPYSTVISDLSSVHDWYVRVFAYNGVGEGLPELAWPCPLCLTAVAPQAPANIKVSVQDATSLEAAWDRPRSIGATELSTFIVQYDTSYTFATRNGMPLGQMTVNEADVDASIAIVSQSFPNSIDPMLRRRIFIGNADAISQGDIGPGVILTIDGRQLTVLSVNDDSCGVACLTMNKDYDGSNASGSKIYLGLDPRHYRLSIAGLIPGVAYFVRVAAANELSVGPFSFDSYPFTPVSSTPMDVPAVLPWAAVSAISPNELLVDFAHPLGKPYGANGSPASKYLVELATGVDEIQMLQVTSTTMTNSTFSLMFDGDRTGCIAFGASAGTMENAIETLNRIDDVLVTRTQSSLLFEYVITFVGPTVAKMDQPLLAFDSSSFCADNGVEINIFPMQDGTQSFRPEIIALSTEADGKVSGFIELSVGYQGEYIKIISVDNQPAQFMVDPGSRVVDTMGYDLTAVLHPGEMFVVGQEKMEVRAVRESEIEVKEYHIRGTSGVAVPGYRMNNYIGSGTISPGGNSLTEINGLSLESVLRSGEVIEVFTDGFGGKEYLTVASVAASSVTFSPRFSGIITETPIYVRSSAILPVTSSSALMQSAIESLLKSSGLVEVSREGPNPSEGFTWYITFHSNMGMPSCSFSSLCLTASTEAVVYISVDGLGDRYDGHYIQSGFNDGRPRYELLEKSCHIQFEFASSEWRLYDDTGSVVSFAVSADTSVPLSGWSNGAVFALSDGAIPLLLGQNAVAEVIILQNDVQQSFDESTLVYSEEIFAGEREVQEVTLLSDDDDVSGSFELSFGAISQNVIVYSNESAEDFNVKLQSLSGVGRVSVESTNPPNRFGRAWLITFLSNSGDVPLLRHHGTADLLGSDVTLSIREKVKGTHGRHHILIDGLDEGNTYSARISAENEAGIGLSTSSQVLGVFPMARSVSSPPGSPILELGTVTKSQANVIFTEPPSNGNNIFSYKFEWTTASSFNTSARANIKVSCSDGSLIWGMFQFTYGKDSGSKKETSVPIDIRSKDVEISQVLNTFKLLNEVEVITITNGTSEVELDIMFLHDVGPIGELSLDTENMQCQSEGLPVDSTIIMTVEGSTPSNYGSKEISANDASCGSVYLGEFSAMQYLTLVANFDAVTAGSYQLSLDGEATVCIPFDASDSQMKDALETLENVEEVHVTANVASIGSQFPSEYTISFIGNYAYGDWPALQVNPSFGDGECDPFVGGLDHRAIILPIRDESLCLNGAENTFAIVADSMTSIGGTFDIHYDQESAIDVSVHASASEMREILAQLISPDVMVSKHDHDDVGEGVAWAVTYPGHRPRIDHIRIVDTYVTGRNARVDAYPIIVIETFLAENDSSGDFRIMIDGKFTAPLSYRASQAKILQEMHRLTGIGKLNMLGPANGDDLSSVNLRALVDDSLTDDVHKAIAIVGDFTSTFAPGDKLVVGTCELDVKRVAHYDFDETHGAGQLYHTHYSTSRETSNARVHGFSIVQTYHSNESLNFADDCSQDNGVNVEVHAGSYLDTGIGAAHSMIVKAFTADLNKIVVIPERNWRGTASRVFSKHPYGIAPRTFTLAGMKDKKNYIVRASARNSQGFGPPSQPIGIKPASTVPSAPRAVMLF
ncbi:hypothetical protein ACHAXH_009869 [Discostella pseudostelligera]